MKLADQVAIITGSSGGIGKAIAMAFAREGARLVLCDIDGEGVSKTREELEGLCAHSTAMRVDVTDAGQVSQLVEKTVKNFGRVDILVNNAGGDGGLGGALNVSDEVWDRVIDLNLKSQFLCCRAVVPPMESSAYGRIVNISSNAGKYRSNVGIGGIPYAAAKAGILQFTRSAAYALGRKGITVNAIAPGSVLTEKGLREYDALGSERRDRVLKETPLGRFARPGEIADIAVFLASRDSSFVTGATILANGGWCTS
jgi:3-oxoacyl-[acyl-carrier protein] reductase